MEGSLNFDIEQLGCLTPQWPKRTLIQRYINQRTQRDGSKNEEPHGADYYLKF